jgi:putative hydrolase of the HAD superfamily
MNSASTDRADALVLDYGGVICLTTFERLPLIERGLGLAPGTIGWQGPFDPDGDPLWCDMLADRISEREYWRRRALEVGRLVGEEWTETRMLMSRGQDDRPETTTRPEALATVKAAREAGRRVGVLTNELDLFNGPEFRRKLPIFTLFHAVVDATYTGILKPDPRAYHAIAEGLGAPIGRCLMVDDQPRNIDGALKAGMQAEWFDVTQPARSYARVLERLGLDAAHVARFRRESVAS